MLKQTRLLFCSTEFPPEPGGIGNHAFGLVRELSLKYQVFVLTENRSKPLLFGEFVRVQLKNTKVYGISRSPTILWTYLKRVLCFIILSKQTNIQFFSGTFYIWLSNFSKTTAKKVVIIHGGEIKQKGLSKMLFRRALLRAHRIVCVSTYTKNKLIESYPIDSIKTKIRVINNGFICSDIGFNRGPFCKSLNLKLITIGGVHKRKGQQNVISAIPDLIKKTIDVEYLIVGIPLEKQYMQNLSETLGVQDKVRFVGVVSDKEKWELLGSSDIFLMLSEELDNGDFEGFGIALMEAMSLGLPVIGTKNSGIADAIKDGYCGHLIDPKNSEEIVSAIQKITNQYERYSLNAKIWSQNFTWDPIGQKYLSLLEEL